MSRIFFDGSGIFVGYVVGLLFCCCCCFFLLVVVVVEVLFVLIWLIVNLLEDINCKVVIVVFIKGCVRLGL